jgi:hypothetical protein
LCKINRTRSGTDNRNGMTETLFVEPEALLTPARAEEAENLAPLKVTESLYLLVLPKFLKCQCGTNGITNMMERKKPKPSGGSLYRSRLLEKQR